MSSGWFVGGTDTGVGKTLTACALLAACAARGRAAVGMKPVASGCRVTPDGPRSADANALMALSAVPCDYHDVNPYAFEPAVAPHLAAGPGGIPIDGIRAAYARLQRLAPTVVVEGVGGWLVPIGPDLTMADVAKSLALPVVLVVGMRLGCLNHALLTADAIAQSGLAFAGWVANRIDPAMESFDDNVAALRARLPAPLVAIFPHGAGESRRLASLIDLSALSTHGETRQKC
jgi:dethiobiotin synthetase